MKVITVDLKLIVAIKRRHFHRHVQLNCPIQVAHNRFVLIASHEQGLDHDHIFHQLQHVSYRHDRTCWTDDAEHFILLLHVVDSGDRPVIIWHYLSQ